MKHLKMATKRPAAPRKPARAQNNNFVLYDNFGNLLFEKTPLKPGAGG